MGCLDTADVPLNRVEQVIRRIARLAAAAKHVIDRLAAAPRHLVALLRPRRAATRHLAQEIIEAEPAA
jgi:hypothetical protein